MRLFIGGNYFIDTDEVVFGEVVQGENKVKFILKNGEKEQLTFSSRGTAEEVYKGLLSNKKDRDDTRHGGERD